MGEFDSRSVKTRDAVKEFQILENSEKLCRGFHQAMKARRTCFISFMKLLFSILNKEKYDIRSAYVYFNFFLETVNSHNLETANHIVQLIFVLESDMKTLLLTNRNARTIQIIL